MYVAIRSTAGADQEFYCKVVFFGVVWFLLLRIHSYFTASY
jgi:hypothetical protein